MRSQSLCFLVLLAACNNDHQVTATCEGPGCIFEPGDGSDPVLRMSQSAASSSTAPCTVADCPAGYNIINGTAGNDNINGTDFADCILGGDGDDQIDGKQGNDYICGGNGNDRLKGQDGNDIIYGEAGNDRIEGENQDDYLDGGDGNDDIKGGDSNDTIVGGDGNDTIEGNNGTDIIDSGNGNDSIDGGDGNDTLEGGPGTDTIYAQNGNDRISGGPGVDAIFPGEGTDTCDPADAVVGCEINGTVCTAPKAASCPSMTTSMVLVDELFTTGAGQASWPENIGWDGDFNGDWYTDGLTARPHNPKWGTCATCTMPAVTGFVKTLNVCPTSGARLSMVARVDAAQTSSQTRTTLVLYFIGESCNNISVATSTPRFANVESDLALYDAAIPAGTTRIIIAPMAYLAADELNSVFYNSLKVTYEPAGKYTTVRSLAADDFSTSETSSYGDLQPTGWGEFGGDWLVHPSRKWATLWNASWGGASAPGQPPVDTGLTKSFTLGAFNAGDVVDLSAFAATSFSASTSTAQLRLIFNDPAATTYESNRLTKSNWDTLTIRRAAIPAGATSAKVVINAYLGTGETASLYVDDLSFKLVRP